MGKVNGAMGTMFPLIMTRIEEYIIFLFWSLFENLVSFMQVFVFPFDIHGNYL